ncbi:flagellar biosynthesis regulator FlaF [Pelagibacterium sp. 26DY04]|uniref:flagellar biosynthesis regulator FlaF n=1 Tax=unclassified Pelagibacterium TaxID=2623280 RepID=UPI0028169F31|nr:MULTISPECIES: flagellar biosynthesis regulator FlaF [unclassified Pelagibacterium]WMT85731.1 flagellar biosynthesis regulator FlaF [Pelagibacterium sp. 26DY04]WMT89984.1 flagellar biosynthesis regulator FlaF [Pelagibacterium sp. H642]
MLNQGALAYQRTAQQTADPRTLESNLLARSASHLQAIRDTWPERLDELDEALNKNRKIWSIFVQSVTNDDHPLPAPVRQNVANLGIFVMGQTYEVMATRNPSKLDALININRQISAGLRGNGG